MARISGRGVASRTFVSGGARCADVYPIASALRRAAGGGGAGEAVMAELEGRVAGAVPSGPAPSAGHVRKLRK